MSKVRFNLNPEFTNLEAVNPLLSLTTLTTDVNHTELGAVYLEFRFGNTSSLGTSAENVLNVGIVFFRRDSIDIVEEAFEIQSVKITKRSNL